MIRALLCATLSAALALETLLSFASAADKADKKADAATVAARQDVAAALAAEAAGNNEERSQLLYKAWLAARDLPEANWHIGRVRVDDDWLPLGEAVSRLIGDADEVKYRELRDKASGGRALRELARWCQKHGMLDRARLHYAQLLSDTSADPGWQKEAVEALQLEQVNGAWFTREEIAERRKQFSAAQAAIENWLPKLRNLQIAIDGDDFKRRDAAIAEFHALQQPEIILPLEAFLSVGEPRFQEETIKRLSTFREYEATQALVKYAVLSPYSLARNDATQALKQRPLHEFVPLLIGALKSQLKSQFQVRWDSQGRIVYEHAVLQEGATSNQLLHVFHLSKPNRPLPTTRRPWNDARTRVNAAPIAVGREESFRNAEKLRDALVDKAELTQAAVEVANSQAQLDNSRILKVLEATIDQQQRQSPDEWQNWWQDYNEYQWPKPTVRYYQTSSQTYWVPRIQTFASGGQSCFLAGTPVRTETGTRPIESLRPGDRVLAQDADTGEFAYKLVLSTTHRPPAKMLKLTIGDDQIVTTLGHPFWVNGHGWKMAKELKAGDLIHSLGGSLAVKATEPIADNPAHNLVVDSFNTYFVGQQGVLVHDNEFRRPTQAIVPGLLASDAASN